MCVCVECVSFISDCGDRVCVLCVGVLCAMEFA